jgi:excisionase family DNA binding protein
LLDAHRVDRIERMLRLAESYQSELPEAMFFTMDEVADLLGASRRTARRYIADGHLRATGIEGSPRVTLAELIRFAKESPLATRWVE